MGHVIRADRRGPARVPAVLVDARAQARALLADAARDAERIREQAHAQGVQAGRAELAVELLRMTQAHEQALAGLEPQALAVALQAAKQLIGAELQARPEQLRAVVAPLIARLRRARSLVLRVHPDDRAALEPWLQAEQSRGSVPAALSVEPDPAITRGGCVLRSEIGTLDAQVETQLGALARALGVP